MQVKLSLLQAHRLALGGSPTLRERVRCPRRTKPTPRFGQASKASYETAAFCSRAEPNSIARRRRGMKRHVSVRSTLSRRCQLTGRGNTKRTSAYTSISVRFVIPNVID